MAMNRELLFSVTAKDCNWDYYRGTGKGGQKKNKTSNCARCHHKPSGAVGKSERGRSREQNHRNAFLRMIETNEFKKWHRIEVARRSGELYDIKRKVDEEMRKIKIEVRSGGKWVEIDKDGKDKEG